ncbi:MAG: hypothetical protein FIB01_07120 [Gemmatimonadetes bacterium]|nr:hypothetical protein [Gemmatimonadota bacterium]
MQTTLGDVAVNRFPGPAYMGHEEVVIPMLLRRSTEPGDPERLCGFGHCLSPAFRPNDLSNTAAAGCRSGMTHQGVDLDRMFVCPFPDDWQQAAEIGPALDALGLEYAFFLEASAAPLEDGFVHRCRFIARERLRDFRPNVDLEASTRQSVPARAVLSAFLRACHGEPDCQHLYGDYAHSREFKHRFGDDEQLFSGCAIWLEQEGVIRAWTRVTYCPK